MRFTLNSGGSHAPKAAHKSLYLAAVLLALSGALLFVLSGEGGAREYGRVSSAASREGGTIDADPLRRWRCTSRRGASGGHWERDMRAAPLMQYAQKHGPVTIADRLHQPDPSDPQGTEYRPPTTYVWRDTRDTEDECGGPVAPLGREEFCRIVVGRLGLGRVLFVGDSLSRYQFFALLGQIGNPRDASYDNEVIYECPDDGWSSNATQQMTSVNISFVKNDWLVPDSSSPLVPPESNKGSDKLKPWVEAYLSEDPSTKTLLIANTGAHYAGEWGRTVPHYHKVIDTFLGDIGTPVLRPDDVVILRTTPDGHPSCLTADRPFKDEDERDEMTRKAVEGSKIWRNNFELYGWGIFKDMNEYVRGAVIRYNNKGISFRGRDGGPAKVHLLDVVPMTSLRPDGHISGPDNLNPDKKKLDCLHYSLPGPIDWWNNLLFANLADLPAASAASGRSASSAA